MSDGSVGLAVFSKGLPEIEALPEKDGVHLALTLLRSVGGLSRRSATPLVIPTPAAQCLGYHVFSYAVYPHSGDWRSGNVWQSWSRYRNDLHIFQPTGTLDIDSNGQVTGGKDDSLARLAPINVDASDFVISAIKSPTPVSGSDALPFNLVFRGFCIASEESSFSVDSPFVIEKAYILNLAEEIVTPVKVQNNRIQLSARPHQIITIGLQMRL